MNTAWMKARQTRYGAYITVYILVVLAIVVGANWLANENNKSYDTTANKRFSLSDATKKTLEGLKNDVTITYFDKTSSFDTARATLDRYRDQSKRIKVNFIDPDKKPELARLARVQTYGQIFVDYGKDKHEEAKSLTEEEITGAIKRAMATGVRTACFVTGSGEAGISDTERDGYSHFKDLLEKSGIKSKELTLLQKAEITPDCTIVVIGGPTHDYIPPVRDAIKKFVEGGGKALIMFTPSIADRTGASEGEPNLEKMVADWGVTVDNDMVYDLGPFADQLGPSVVAVGHYDTHPIVKDIGRVVTILPLSRSLNVKTDKGMEKLFESSDTSFMTENLKPPIKVNPDKDKKGPFTIAAAGTVNGKSRIVVVGSSSWVSNSIIGYPTANRDLALNMVNWLTADESLISIPSKEPEDRRIMLSGRQMNMIALSSVVFLPLLVVLSGFAVWWKRR